MHPCGIRLHPDQCGHFTLGRFQVILDIVEISFVIHGNSRQVRVLPRRKPAQRRPQACLNTANCLRAL